MYKTLKSIRIVLAAVVLLGFVALLLDGVAWALGVTPGLGFLPKTQLLPAILALNVVVVVAILLVTLLVGRLYCSVLCPMGILQDVFTWVNKVVFRRKYRYYRPQNWLRYAVLAFFVALMVMGSFGIASGIAAFIDPYSAFARMTIGFFDSRLPLVVSVAIFAVIFVMSFFWGRLWCNTLCPVGSLLSLVSRWSLFGIRIDKEKCVGCHKCEHRCKANCIDVDGCAVDGSRCVMCFNCLGHCKQDAIKIARRTGKPATSGVDDSRRKFVAVTAAVGAATVLHAQEEKVAAGMALAEGKAVAESTTSLKPAGAGSLRNFTTRCTACQLCVSKCPSRVLRPSMSLDGFMQPYMAFDQGFCRPDCTLCSQVCPSGAIKPVDPREKTSISIGRAMVLADNCLGCAVCVDHCPSQAIFMVSDGYAAVNENKCIGCGACEHHCPATPKAVFVKGYEVHGEI